jgi:hypothetical protein
MHRISKSKYQIVNLKDCEHRISGASKPQLLLFLADSGQRDE